MDKQDINNQIVRLRSVLKRSRARLIMKMVSQIRHFKNAKGTEEQRQKNLRKAERWHQQLQHLRKVDINAIAREAFTSEICWNKVITDPNTSLERRAEARLANEKLSRSIIEKFRLKNPMWKSWVPQIVDMWNRRKQFRAECNAAGDAEASDEGESGEDDDDEEAAEDASPPQSSRKRSRKEDGAELPSKKTAKLNKTTEWVVQPIRSKEKKSVKSKMTPPVNTSRQDEDTEEGSSSSSGSEDAVQPAVTKKPSKKTAPAAPSAAEATLKPAKVKSQQKVVAKADAAIGRSKVVVPVDLSRLEADDELCLASDGRETDSEEDRDAEESRPPKKKDSFFRGPEDSDEEEEEPRGGFRRGGFRRGRGFDRGSFRGRGNANFSPVEGGRPFGRGSFNRNSGNEGRGFGGRGARGRGDRFGRGFSRDRRQQWESGDVRREAEPKKGTKAQESLHPSWAAKKQQQASIAPFRGTRITFD